MRNKTPEPNQPVWMTRENLENISEFSLPKPFSLRWFRSGDEQTWLKIQSAADRDEKFTPESFAQIFGNDFSTLHERQCFLLDAREIAIGTGTAWFDENFEGARWGRIHWMAIAPEFQRLGLGKALMSIVCRRLRELGHERAYLKTSTPRLAAINLYLHFGFAPLIRNSEDAENWRALQPKLKFPLGW